jgi:RNA polymerase sigma factor (sigma-70 family)
MDYENLSISELLKLCLESGGEVWTAFIDRIQGPVAGKIIRTLGKLADPATVDDLVQETWLKLFRDNAAALRRIRDEHQNTIYDYVTTAARRTALDYISQRGPDIPLDELVEPPNSRWQEVDKTIRRNEVDHRLRKLSAEPQFERDYLIFWRYYEQGYSAREISEISGINLSVKGVEAVIWRLTNYVRGSLNPGDADPDPDSGD